MTTQASTQYLGDVTQFPEIAMRTLRSPHNPCRYRIKRDTRISLPVRKLFACLSRHQYLTTPVSTLVSY